MQIEYGKKSSFSKIVLYQYQYQPKKLLNIQ